MMEAKTELRFEDYIQAKPWAWLLELTGIPEACEGLERTAWPEKL